MGFFLDLEVKFKYLKLLVLKLARMAKESTIFESQFAFLGECFASSNFSCIFFWRWIRLNADVTSEVAFLSYNESV